MGNGLKRKIADLLVWWPYKDGVQRAVIELKIGTADWKQQLKKGCSKPGKYMDALAAAEGYLIVVNRAKKRRGKKKSSKRKEPLKT